MSTDDFVRLLLQRLDEGWKLKERKVYSPDWYKCPKSDTIITLHNIQIPSSYFNFDYTSEWEKYQKNWNKKVAKRTQKFIELWPQRRKEGWHQCHDRIWPPEEDQRFYTQTQFYVNIQLDKDAIDDIYWHSLIGVNTMYFEQDEK